MKVYDDYFKKIIQKDTFIKILELVQSFAWRRFILGLPTNALNKIFMSLYEKVDHNNYLYSIQKSLLQRTGSQRFPKNKEVIEALKTKDVYNIKSKNRTYFLERLENFENKEFVLIDGNQDITVEHIFPQNPDQKWKIELGTDEFNFIKDNYLNTIANLTLSGNNGKLGNKSFIEKRDLQEAGYKASRLWLNKYLAVIDKWDRTEIEKRYNFISERALNIWLMPNISVEERLDSNEENIFDADDPTDKKLEYAIFFDNKIEVNQVAKLYVEVFKRLFDLQPETFFTTEIGTKIGLTQYNQNKISPYVKLNDSYFIETNFSNKQKFDRIKQALIIFGFEDELMIKFMEETDNKV